MYTIFLQVIYALHASAKLVGHLILHTLLTAMFNPLHNSKNRSKFASVINVASMKNMNNLYCTKEAIVCDHQIDQRCMEQKEDTG